MNQFSRFALHASTVLIFLAPHVAQAQWSKPEQGELFIHGGWLFDSVSDSRRRNSGIFIRNGEIVEVDADARQHRHGAATVIELEDSDTILPGMLDLHAHYNLDLVDNGRVEEVVYNGLVFLANGVTSPWSAGEYYPERVIAQRDLIDAGQATGPRLFASGPYFGAFRCEYSIKTAADDCIAWPNDITEKEIRREVDKWAEQGVISIKIKQATPGEAKILIEQAHKNGMTTVGHLANYDVEYDIDLRDAILLGMDRVEHDAVAHARQEITAGGPRVSDHGAVGRFDHGPSVRPRTDREGVLGHGCRAAPWGTVFVPTPRSTSPRRGVRHRPTVDRVY